MTNALSDPDNAPLTQGDLARLKPLPKARALRIRLRLTREEFAARYHIPLGALRDWEQRGPSRRTRALAAWWIKMLQNTNFPNKFNAHQKYLSPTLQTCPILTPVLSNGNASRDVLKWDRAGASVLRVT
jgi:DNA-binding transcriptional regulator YiaG